MVSPKKSRGERWWLFHGGSNGAASRSCTTLWIFLYTFLLDASELFVRQCRNVPLRRSKGSREENSWILNGLESSDAAITHWFTISANIENFPSRASSLVSSMLLRKLLAQQWKTFHLHRDYLAKERKERWFSLQRYEFSSLLFILIIDASEFDNPRIRVDREREHTKNFRCSWRYIWSFSKLLAIT